MGFLDDYQKSRGTERVPYQSRWRGESGSVPLSAILFVISIICGNIASGYTTLWGLQETITQFWIAALITITVQGMMLATALLISRKVEIARKLPYFSIYVVPMIVSISFNYIYFHSKFTKSSLEKIQVSNTQINIRNIQEHFIKGSTEVISKVQKDISEELKKERGAAESSALAMDDELTVRGTGGAGPGPYYKHYREQSAIHKTNQKFLESLLKKIETKKTKVMSMSRYAIIDSLQTAYTVLAEIIAESGDVSNANLPSFPKLEQEELLKKGQKHEVYEAFGALLHPTKFEIISLLLGILMDFVIFVWVIIKLVSKTSLVEVIS